MAEPVVEVDTTVDAPPDKVWTALTNKKSPMFMGATMDTDFKAGSKYTLKGEWNGNAFTDYGAIETAEPGKELSFTHWSKTPAAARELQRGPGADCPERQGQQGVAGATCARQAAEL